MPEDSFVASTGASLDGCSLFISYASDDRETVLQLRDALRKAGADRVWVDRPEIDPGDRWKEEIKDGIGSAQAMLAVVTRHGVDATRRWIVFEQEEALRLFRPVIPLRFDSSALPERLGDIQYADFTGDWSTGFERLVAALEKKLLRSGDLLADESRHLRHAFSFVGREGDIRAVADLLRGEDEERVQTTRPTVAVQGMGGMGKSMLAVELVLRMGPCYPGGVLYVKHGKGAEDAQVVLQRWVEHCEGRHPEREVTPAEVRSRLSRYGQLLVLIDDVGESDFKGVRLLLDALPPDASRLLTTRSTKVELDLGARVYELERLPEEDALELLRRRLIRLKKPPDEDVLRELVARLDGHPQALSLLAGRCDQGSDLPAILEELEDVLETGDLRLEELDIEEEDTDKYSSVAASLALSYRGLERLDRARGSDLAERFLALGIFPGSALIDREMSWAAWGVAATDRRSVRKARRALDVYGRRAMLELDEETEHYLLHPLMRAFAFSRLRDDESRFRRVRSRYIRHVVDRATEIYSRPPQEWSAFQYYERHLQYVGRGLVRGVPERLGGDLESLSRPEARRRERDPDELDPEVEEELRMGCDFADAVRRFVVLRPELEEWGRDWLRVGVASARALGDDLRLTRLLRYVGRWHLRRSAKVAEPYFAESVRLAANRRNEPGFLFQEGAALSYRGEALRALSRPDEAIDCLLRALEIHRRLGDSFMEATTLKFLGETHWRQGDLAAALSHHEEALELFRSRGGLVAQEADMLNKVGSVHFNAGRQEMAIERFEEALQVHREVGNRFMEAEDLNDIGISYKYLGRLDEAEPRLWEAVEVAREVGYARLEAIALCNLAQLHNEREEYERSRELAEEARGRARDVEDRVPWSWALNWIGLALQHAGDVGGARRSFEEGLELIGGRSLRTEVALLANLGWLEARRLDEPERGLERLEDSVRMLEESDSLEQAYGGRRVEDLRELLARARERAG